MKKHMRKVRTKKNSNYKNAQGSGNITMNIEKNWANGTERGCKMIMENQQMTHDNMVAITKELYKSIGLSPTFFEDENFATALKVHIRLLEQERDIVEAIKKNTAENFQGVLFLSDEGIEYYNKSLSAQDQFSLFTETVLVLIEANRINRSGLLNYLVMLAMNNRNDRIASRIGLLIELLTDPQRVTQVRKVLSRVNY